MPVITGTGPLSGGLGSATLVSVATNPIVGTLTYANTVLVILTFSQPVTVTGGQPTLTLDDGGTATLDPAQSTALALAFTHTVQLNQNSAGLQIVAAHLNGSTIVDASGHPVSLDGAIGTLPGQLQVDTTPPAVVSMSADPAAGDLKAGLTVSFTFTMDEPATVLGIPKLRLNDGGVAVFDPLHSSSTQLRFVYTVQSGQNVSALAISNVDLSQAMITDAVGNSSFFADALVPIQGTVQVDTTPPQIVATSTDPTTAILQAGQILTVTLTSSEPVSVIGGTPTLALANGGIASLDLSASTPNALTFHYTALAAVPVSSLGIGGLVLGTATIMDGAGNALVSSAALSLLSSIGSAVAPGLSTTASDPAASPDVGTSAKINSHTIAMYRFFDTTAGTHFYTSDQGERASILATRPDLVPEGASLRAVDPASEDPAAAPVFRFFDRENGTQFLTASVAERDQLQATRPDLIYEPTSKLFEHSQQQAGDTPVYRFFDSRFGTHFYTDSPEERATILTGRHDLIPEGIGFYEPAAS